MSVVEKTVFHLLIIHDFSRARKILLEDAEYTIGRDPSNDIVIDNPGISRLHAHLIQVPDEADPDNCIYQMVDGSLAGKPSRNGTTVNDKACDRKILEPGDMILFGSVVSAEYVTLVASQDLKLRNLDRPKQESSNSDVTDPRRTLYNLSLMDTLTDEPESAAESPSDLPSEIDDDDMPTTVIINKESSASTSD